MKICNLITEPTPTLNLVNLIPVPTITLDIKPEPPDMMLALCQVVINDKGGHISETSILTKSYNEYIKGK